jgi:hypothetical protein
MASHTVEDLYDALNSRNTGKLDEILTEAPELLCQEGWNSPATVLNIGTDRDFQNARHALKHIFEHGYVDKLKPEPLKSVLYCAIVFGELDLAKRVFSSSRLTDLEEFPISGKAKLASILGFDKMPRLLEMAPNY